MTPQKENSPTTAGISARLKSLMTAVAGELQAISSRANPFLKRFSESSIETESKLKDSVMISLRDVISLSEDRKEIERLKAELQEAHRLYEVAQKKRDGHYIQLEAERKRNAELNSRIGAISKDLAVAQEKRNGHYLHLEAERKKTARLLKQVELLERDNRRMRESLSWAVGYAIVNTKSLKAAIQLPAKLMIIFRAHNDKKRKKAGEKLLKLQSPVAKVASTPPSQPQAGQINGVPAPQTTEIQSKPNTQLAGSEILVQGWPMPEENGKPRVMSIFDEFSRECFAPQAALIEPRPDNWLPLLNRDKPQMLFVESTWRGNYSTWQYRVAKYANPPGNELSEMVAECRRQGVPTVFWNKEDPVHFDNFIHAASQFDYVFTTAEEAISKYQARSTAKVQALPFAAEPKLHNPIGSSARNGKVCFAGSYYANRFVERRNDQLMLLDAASSFDLDIYDRNHGRAASDFCFPERFTPFVKGSLPYTEMGRAYREYSVFLNVNSVIDSRTMFSRRVFELMACGTPIVSTVSKGIDEMFGRDLVWTVGNETEARKAIATLLNEPEEWRRRSIQGIRNIFQKHTFAHRFQTIMDVIGQPSSTAKGRVLVVASANESSQIPAIVESIQRQKVETHEVTVVMVTSRAVEERNFPASWQIVESNDVGAVIKEKIQQLSPDFVWMPEASAEYGAHFLQDLLIAASYSGAAVIGKASDGSDAYAYGATLDSSSCIISAARLAQCDVEDFQNRSTLLTNAATTKSDIYAADSANFVRVSPNAGQSERMRKLAAVEI